MYKIYQLQIISVFVWIINFTTIDNPSKYISYMYLHIGFKKQWMTLVVCSMLIVI